MRPFAEGPKLGVGLQHGVLHQVLGVGAAAGHPPCTAVELIQQRDRVAFEPGRQLRVALRAGGAGMRGPNGGLTGEFVAKSFDVQASTPSV